MDHFNYREGRLFAEDIPVTALAEQFGTPCYVYSRATFERHYRAWEDALTDIPHLICYAVKANSNLAVLNLLARLGAGFDIVSGGELARVLAAGGDPARVVFSGVGKTADEIRQALQAGVHCFNVESAPELRRIARIATELQIAAPVSLRVNPDVDAKTHPYISTGLKENKFGVTMEEARDLYRWAASHPSLNVIGIDCHIGSQLTETDPFLAALDRVLALIDELAEDGIQLEHIDLGGGLGVRYNDETPPHPSEYIARLTPRLKDRGLALVLEPGRSIAANAGILLTRVEYLKETPHKHFAIVDAAMNDLIRPALYSAWQAIIPAELHEDREVKAWDIVGPVCETGDFLGKERELGLAEGDLLVVRSAGAYGFVMASNYNSRPRPPEIMVDGEAAHVIRRRETVSELFSTESLLPGGND
ncbi:MAG: diaminopimelate decarboxylase [Gammaproteobacteria bacterium]|nr:MAG: diaminopimelate decarboxylase [Gammaproteobacteria bacterium]